LDTVPSETPARSATSVTLTDRFTFALLVRWARHQNVPTVPGTVADHRRHPAGFHSPV
jgi:hypothetical protein